MTVLLKVSGGLWHAGGFSEVRCIVEELLELRVLAT
jgi:hypothetical protein